MPSRSRRLFAGAEPIRIPKLRHHKPSGRAVVELSGAHIYCGPWGSREAKAEYDRVTAAWLANGRKLPGDADDLRIAELVDRYLDHADAYYRRPDGKPSGEAHPIRSAFVKLSQRFGRQRVAAFGPMMLRSYQSDLVALGWARTTINQAVGRVRRMFRWGTSHELIRPSILEALKTLEPLKRGRTAAKESAPIRPVHLDKVSSTLPYLPRPVQAMVRLQAATGMRPGEVCIVRTADLDRSTSPWKFTPHSHKCEVHGKSRVIYFGPTAQAAIAEFLNDAESHAYIFRPSDSMSEMRVRRANARIIPLHYGNSAGTNRKRNPRRLPADRYTSTSYARAICRACEAAFNMPIELRSSAIADLVRLVKREEANPSALAERRAAASSWREANTWAPNQIRHTVGTRVRAEFGIEAASTVLGHSNLSTTEIYAEINERKAAEIAAKIG